MPMHDLLVLDDPTLKSMAVDQRFLADFPFLSTLAAKPGGCGRCGRRSTSATATQNTDVIKRTLVNLPIDKKKKLLQLLNAKQVRLRYRDGNQVVVKTIKTA